MASSTAVPTARTTSRAFSKPLLWTLMALAALSVLIITELPILRDHTGPNHTYLLRLIHDRVLFIPHALFGTLALLIGPVQFSSRIRRKHLQFHRILGRVYAISVLIAAPCAILIAAMWQPTLAVATSVQGGAWFLCTAMAVLMARNGHIPQHRQWMIRSYAVTFLFILLRVPNFWPPFFNISDANFTLVDLIAVLLCFVLPDLAFNYRELTHPRTNPIR
jgi:uncharacterized membrane protein